MLCASWRRTAFEYLFQNGEPGRIRTPDPLIRSQVLYPAELPVHAEAFNTFLRQMQTNSMPISRFDLIVADFI